MLVWDVASGKQVSSFGKGWVTTVAFSPDAKHALSGSDDAIVRLWDLDTGKEVRKFEGRKGWVVSLAFSPDGRRIASGTTNQTIQVWNVETGKEVIIP